MIARAAVIVLAVAAALLPVPAPLVEQWFSGWWYPRVQNILTPLSNTVPIALLDISSAALLAAFAAICLTRARRHGWRQAATRGVMTVLTWSAVLFIAFLALWGLNYRRVPLTAKVDYQQQRITRDAAVAFAGRAVTMVNAGYAGAHASGADDAALARSFAEAQRSLGASWLAVPGVPKRSLLSIYFRRAAIDGMTDPIFLEVILNAGVLPVERPFVLAHEWAHLAGYADESEANFVAWLTCARGDARARYSGWLAAYEHTLGAIPRAERKAVPPLAEGPREDLRAMAQRYATSSPVVRNAARGLYDKYLRANRVPEGIASYEVVVRLFLGTSFDDQWRPRLK